MIVVVVVVQTMIVRHRMADAPDHLPHQRRLLLPRLAPLALVGAQYPLDLLDPASVPWCRLESVVVVAAVVVVGVVAGSSGSYYYCYYNNNYHSSTLLFVDAVAEY